MNVLVVGGAGYIGGAVTETVLHSVKMVLALKDRWLPPSEYVMENVSRTVIKILTGYLCKRATQ